MMDEEDFTEFENEAVSTLDEEDELEDEPIDTRVLDIPTTQFWQKSYAASLIPFAALDTKLRVLWENRSFQDLFNKDRYSAGVHLLKIFTPYLDNEKIHQLYTSIQSVDSGYSWKGRVESSDREHLTKIANMIIFPIFDFTSNSPIPVGYAAVLDNITEENKNLLRNTFLSLLEASKLKDNDTGQHIERVNMYSRILAGALFSQADFSEINKEFIDNIAFLAAMHDVGKIGTPDDILNKNGPLEEREWEIMKEHTINGAYILGTYPNPMAKQIALFHHEHWDGNGYPYGLSEKMIPLAARIVAIADVYDALRMERSYKRAFSHAQTLREIENAAGSHFDPLLVRFFIKLEKNFEDIYSRLADN
ncbi:MAG: HD domain-containing phosphohydrolase [Spirochaetota bacterium]